MLRFPHLAMTFKANAITATSYAYVCIFQLLVNSIALHTSRLDFPSAFGSGLYLSASFFDHSCDPNAEIEFRGREVAVRAREDIVVIDGFRLDRVRTLFMWSPIHFALFFC
jgi:hypothetical protein